MKVVTIVGARPQFIKAATVSREISKRFDIQEIIVHTGQHYDHNMSDIFFTELSIPRPGYNLGVGGGPHGQMTGRQLEEIEKVLLIESPDLVLVYGDTNSTLAGALAASKLHILIGHIEAGLRSDNKKMPEEINRILTDHVSDILFTPTTKATINLENESIGREKIYNVGDVMYDASIFYIKNAKKPRWYYQIMGKESRYILATIHRAENTDDPSRLSEIMLGLGKSKYDIILPLHPRTKQKILDYGIRLSKNIKVTDPVGYLEMVWLESNCYKIATDSGGVQKEAYFHKKFCITMRQETEWSELVESGWNKLVGTNPDAIASGLEDVPEIRSNPNYGKGDSAIQIVDILIGLLS